MIPKIVINVQLPPNAATPSAIFCPIVRLFTFASHKVCVILSLFLIASATSLFNFLIFRFSLFTNLASGFFFMDGML